MNLSIRYKIALMAVVPVLLTALFLTFFTYFQLKKIGETEIESFRQSMRQAKEQELKQYIDLALSSIKKVYDNSSADDPEAKAQVAAILQELSYGSDGYIFLNDDEGVVLANKAKPELVGQNLIGMKDKNGVYIFKELIDAAKKGGGYVSYQWFKASKNTEVEKLSYAVELKKWNWVLGTGFYVDDIQDAVKAKEDELQSTVTKTIMVILTMSALITGGIIIVSFFLSSILTRSIKSINQFLKEVSDGEGDLTRDLPILSNDEMGEMARHFNKFIGKLNEIISIVKEGSENVASASTELASTTEELTVTFLDQAGQVTSVASATEEISVTSQHVMQSIGEANDQAAKTEKLTREGKQQLLSSVSEVMGIKEKVEKLGKTINNLASSSSEIGNIVSVINDIADQTNLLALNAAIEAARAGEHGRGFAVVADEVRKLAERTQSATKEIENIIASLQSETRIATVDMDEATGKVVSGAKAIQGTEAVFSQIVVSVESINRTNHTINGAIQEQVSAIGNINENAQVISSGIDESSNALAQVTATVADLQKQADDLHIMVSKFKTRA
ncbi:methyl-accepting chemotaxis protein [Seleniivibrio woodruffii]|uniref:Methyl-accepting chemotaxis sensory transducer with Cache sensor n=1 Tax=Seleniivibrio woodruffii TaxID=1078050 RepID=A0A4R1K7X7_9BACT|nr:methyl-accepting chemotaxis protein [Seleniivibrio woodruffii]TCK60395.1 methyl-accepting chemotaxis sensory transducer with Cache sensor [Seleniivibrio woodruffii]TVZ36022.1 methyl-accepting chemotaxis sensory transducer with Cache sensor [Seleniivibrio woodruffii]